MNLEQKSKQWWESVKSNSSILEHWLKKQYYGEMTASNRMQDLLNNFGEQTSIKNRKILKKIMKQERQHADWIKQLLVDRNIEIKEEYTDRYWNEVPRYYIGFEMSKTNNQS